MKRAFIGIIGIAVVATLLFLFLKKDGGPQIGEEGSKKSSGSSRPDRVAQSGDSKSGSGAGGVVGAPADGQKIASECKTIKYKHKDLSAHSDGEACLHHENSFLIAAADANPKAVCVKVNRNVVKHQIAKRADGLEVRIGAVAGPNSEVAISWCPKSVKCNLDCKIAKDEFMDALTGSADSAELSGWDTENKKDNEAVEKEIKNFRAISGEVGGKANVFREWLVTSEEKITSCSK